MKMILFIALVIHTSGFSQEDLDYKLRRLEGQLRVLREETEQANRLAQKQVEDSQRDRAMEDLQRSRQLRQDSESRATEVNQAELIRTLDSLEVAQQTRRLSESEIRWLNTTISGVRERYNRAVSAEINFYQREFLIKKIWELPFFDRMVLIQSRENEILTKQREEKFYSEAQVGTTALEETVSNGESLIPSELEWARSTGTYLKSRLNNPEATSNRDTDQVLFDRLRAVNQAHLKLLESQPAVSNQEVEVKPLP